MFQNTQESGFAVENYFNFFQSKGASLLIHKQVIPWPPSWSAKAAALCTTTPALAPNWQVEGGEMCDNLCFVEP